ncbi:MAG: signal peptidase II [Bacteroidota bacterium]
MAAEKRPGRLLIYKSKRVMLLKRFLIIMAIIGVSVGVDQYSKQWAVAQLKGEPRTSYLGDTFRLQFAENTGAFLSMGANQSETIRYWVLKVFPIIMLTGLFFYLLFSKSLDWWQIAAFSFILGGGLSNIYDRLQYGKVVDFMNIGIGNLRSGIFNVADMSIMLGLFILIPIAFRKESKPKPEQPTEA